MGIDSARREPALFGVPLKHLSLVTLTVQNSALILIMHYSRIMAPPGGQRYYTSTAVFLNEVLKLTICLSMALYEIAQSPKTPDTSTAASLFGQLSRAVFTGDSWKLAIPAVLYTLQNSLQYIAVSNLDAATFQVTYQLKILTTALCSVTMLGRTLSVRRWTSLVLLMLGVAIVQIPPPSSDHGSVSRRDLSGLDVRSWFSAVTDQITRRSATYEGIHADVTGAIPELNRSVGLSAVIVACMISGLAGVYFEKILKDARGDSRSTSVWVRNVQLSFYSLWPALFIGVIFKDGEHIAHTGFFTGYNWVVWTAIIFQASGGIIVALVVNYADNIAKNFATSISIILSSLASVFFFDFHITTFYLLGTIIVLVATYLYNTTPASKSTDEHKVGLPPIQVTHPDDRDGSNHLELKSIGRSPRTPGFRDLEALTTSRPGTPTHESYYRSRGPEDMKPAKRYD